MLLKRTSLFLFVSLLPLSVRADDLGTIIVTDGVENGARQQDSQTTIKLSDIQKQVLSLPEVLDREAGIHLQRLGGLESFTSISIRGSSPDDVDVSLDGISLNSARGNGVDLSPLLLGSLDRIEIHRGFNPLENVATPSGGAVQLQSRKIRQGLQISAQAGYGSFNTWDNHLSLTVGKPKWGFLISQALSGTQGNFSFEDDNGTPFNAADDRHTKRRNNDSLTVYPLFKIYYQFDDDHRLEWINHFIRKESGVPGLSTNQSTSANVDSTQYLTALKWLSQSFFSNKISFESLSSLRLLKNQYSDINGEIGLGGAQDNDDDTTVLNQKFEWNWSVNAHHALKALFDYQFERYRPENFLATPAQGAASLRHTLNFSLGGQGEYWDGKFKVTPGIFLVRLYNDVNNDDPSFLTPATFSSHASDTEFGGQLKLDYEPFTFLNFYSQFNRGFRFPTFSELFGDRGGIVGNPLISPEQSYNWEIGVGSHFAGEGKLKPFVRWQADYFERRVDNLIQFQQQSGFARAENVGEAKVSGIETSVTTGFKNWVDLTGNYTFQDAKDAQTGRYLVGRPRHELELRLTSYWKKASVFVSNQWSDEIFLDPLNTRRVSSRFILNSGISYSHKGWTFSLEGKNLANDQIVDVVGFPLPGRSFFGKLTYEFSKLR